MYHKHKINFGNAPQTSHMHHAPWPTMYPRSLYLVGGYHSSPSGYCPWRPDYQGTNIGESPATEISAAGQNLLDVIQKGDGASLVLGTPPRMNQGEPGSGSKPSASGGFHPPPCHRCWSPPLARYPGWANHPKWQRERLWHQLSPDSKWLKIHRQKPQNMTKRNPRRGGVV